MFYTFQGQTSGAKFKPMVRAMTSTMLLCTSTFSHTVILSNLLAGPSLFSRLLKWMLHFWPFASAQMPGLNWSAE